MSEGAAAAHGCLLVCECRTLTADTPRALLVVSQTCCSQSLP